MTDKRQKSRTPEQKDREAILVRRRQLVKATLASVGLGAALVSCRDDVRPVPCLEPLPPPTASARPCLSVAMPKNTASADASIDAHADAGAADASFDASADASAATRNVPPRATVEPPRPCLTPRQPPPKPQPLPLPCLKPMMPKDFKR